MESIESTKEDIEAIFLFQDFNKFAKFNATTEEQLKQVEEIDAKIMQKLKELYVPCKV